MPSKNAIKKYVENGYYHIYNRGVEKRNIFQDDTDYSTFLAFLAEYLQPKDEKALLDTLSLPGLSMNKKEKILKTIRLNNFSQEILLLAYALMPNHFHIFLKQRNAGSIDTFMRSICTRYVMYFNHKYKRVGSLFQDVYKAALIEDEAHYIHISRYIHKQAIELPDGLLKPLQPSSYQEYIGERKTDWVHPEEMLSIFSKDNPKLSYKQFVLEYNPLDLEKVPTLEG
jgi:putative transposase